MQGGRPRRIRPAHSPVYGLQGCISHKGLGWESAPGWWKQLWQNLCAGVGLSEVGFVGLCSKAELDVDHE